MKEDLKKTEETALSRQEGKKKAKGSPAKRRLIPAANYKQSVRDTFTDRESVAGDLYTMAEICQKFNYTYGRFYNLRMCYSIPCIKANATKCFPKAEVDKAMAEEAERLGNNLSEHWYSCFDIMRLFGLGKTQVRRFALTHGVRTKRIHGNRLYYLKADWDAAAHQPSGEPSHGGEGQDHPPAAKYAESEQAYPQPVCGYALQGQRSIQASHRCDYPFRYGAGETPEQHSAVGAWLCDYAESRQPFDEIKHRHTLKEVGDVAEGKYDWKINSTQSNGLSR